MKAAPAGRVKAERSEPKGSLDTDAAPDTIVPGGHAPHRGHAPLGATGGLDVRSAGNFEGGNQGVKAGFL